MSDKKIRLPRKAKKIVVDREVWYWKGTRSGIFLISPKGNKQFITYRELGHQWSDVERSQWDRTFHITPKEVEKYIRGL